MLFWKSTGPREGRLMYNGADRDAHLSDTGASVNRGNLRMGPIVMGRVLIPTFLLLAAACGPSDRVEPTSSEPDATINHTGETRSGPEQRANDQPGCNRGNPNAPIRLEVFSDYECPSCRAFICRP